jgi:hypothetical protein
MSETPVSPDQLAFDLTEEDEDLTVEEEPHHHMYDEDVPLDAEPDFEAEEQNPKVVSSDG